AATTTTSAPQPAQELKLNLVPIGFVDPATSSLTTIHETATSMPPNPAAGAIEDRPNIPLNQQLPTAGPLRRKPAGPLVQPHHADFWESFGLARQWIWE